LGQSKLRGVNLSNAQLTDARLVDADLSDADLTGVNLRNANLLNANLTGANLTGADLTGANLAQVNLDGAIGLYQAPPMESNPMHSPSSSLAIIPTSNPLISVCCIREPIAHKCPKLLDRPIIWIT
jgi:uncharacterized protein YjbI with pentapeptide repeats